MTYSKTYGFGLLTRLQHDGGLNSDYSWNSGLNLKYAALDSGLDLALTNSAA